MAAYLSNRSLPELPEAAHAREMPASGTPVLDWMVRLKRNLGKILLGALVAAGLGIAVTWIVPPRYTAEATIMLESRDLKVVNIDPVLTRLPSDDLVTEGEVQVLRSRDLAQKVVARLDLLNSPEFAEPPEAERNWLASRLASWIEEASGLLASVLPSDEPEPRVAPAAPSPVPGEADHESLVLDRFQKSLKVRPVGRSRVMSISFTAKDPDLAARVANMVARVYLENQVETKSRVNRTARAWVENHLARLEEKVRRAELELAEYRKQSGITLGRGEREVNLRRVSDLSARLLAAQNDRTALEARLQEASRALAARPMAPAAMQTFDTSVLGTLLQREADLASRMAGMDKQHGPEYPAVARASSELAKVRSAIQAEGNRIVAGARSDLTVAQTREGLLRGELERLRAGIDAMATAEITLNALEREADGSRMLLETFITRANESELGIQVEIPDAYVVSHAAVPIRPSFPDMWIVMPAVFLCYGALVVFVMVVARHLDRGFRSLDQLEMNGLPAFGLVPLIERRLGRRGRSVAAFQEAIQTVRVSLDFLPQRPGAKVVLVTSSLPREGKSTLAMALARMEAAQGRRALLVDCDFRSPTRLSLREEQPDPGLIDYLRGRSSLNDVVRTDEATRVSFLPAGNGGEAGSAALLSSDAMQALVGGLRFDYDLIILDSAPLMVVVDALRLCRYVDRTVFAVRWAHTRRETVLRCLRMMAQSGFRDFGVALTMVDANVHAKYNFSDSGCYSKDMDQYYRRLGDKGLAPVKGIA